MSNEETVECAECDGTGRTGKVAPEHYGTEPITIQLRTPIKYGSRLVTEIVVRPVKAKFMRGLDLGGGGMAATLLLASKLTGEVSEVIDELSGPDLRDVLEAVNGFLFAIQATG